MAVVDRSFARMVAIKRVITGTLGLACGGILIALEQMHGRSPTAMVGVALLLFWGGGSWALYDGIRLWKALKR